PHPVHHVVQTGLQRHQKVVARHPGLLRRTIEQVPEVPLGNAVDALDLLLLTELLRVVGRLPPPRLRKPVLSRRVVPPLDRALLRVAPRPLQEQLLPLASAELADRTRVTSHDRNRLSPLARSPLLGLPPARRPGGLRPSFPGAAGAPRALDPPLLRRPAAVVRDRRHIPDGLHLQTRGRKRLDRGLPPAPRTLHPDVHPLHPQVHGLTPHLLRRHRRRERRRFLGALEARLPGATPRDHVPRHVRDRDQRVVER